MVALFDKTIARFHIVSIFTMFFSRSARYFPISLEKDGGRDSSEEDDSQIHDLVRDSNRLSSTRTTFNLVMGTIALCLALLLISGAFILGITWRPDLDRVCLEHTSMWCKLPPDQHPR